MRRLDPSFAIMIMIMNWKGVLLSVSLCLMLFLTSELDRGTEVETTEGSSSLVAPDQLEARLMSCCWWCCQGAPSAWRTTILGIIIIIIIIIIILGGRLVKEGMVRELGHEETSSSSGLLTGLSDGGQTEVGATVERETFETLAAGETAPGLASATAIKTTILFGHISERLLFLKSSETGAGGAQGMMSS